MTVGVVVGAGVLDWVEVQDSQHNRDVVHAKLLWNQKGEWGMKGTSTKGLWKAPRQHMQLSEAPRDVLESLHQTVFTTDSNMREN